MLTKLLPGHRYREDSSPIGLIIRNIHPGPCSKRVFLYAFTGFGSHEPPLTLSAVERVVSQQQPAAWK